MGENYGLQPPRTQVTVASNDAISLETISRPEHVNEASLATAYASQHKARPKLAISLTEFDTNPMQLCVGNGVMSIWRTEYV